MHSTLAARTSVCIIFNSSQNDFSKMEREKNHTTRNLFIERLHCYHQEHRFILTSQNALNASLKKAVSEQRERNKWISFVFILCSIGFVSFQGSCKQIISNFPNMKLTIWCIDHIQKIVIFFASIYTKHTHSTQIARFVAVKRSKWKENLLKCCSFTNRFVDIHNSCGFTF